MFILQKIRKLQAVVATLAETHEFKLNKVKDKFMNSISIFTDSEEEEKYEKQKNGLQQFMEVNENDLLNELKDEIRKKMQDKFREELIVKDLDPDPAGY